MSFNVEYTRGVPVTAATQGGQLPTVPVPSRRGSFGVYVHPNKWRLEVYTENDTEVAEWFPVVDCRAAIPGVNGTTSTDAGVVDGPYRSRMAQDGYIDVTNDRRLVSKFGVLVNRVAQADGGAHYIPPWEMVGVVAGRTRRATDEEMYRAFRRAVIDVVGVMPPEVLEDHTKRIDFRIGMLRNSRAGGSAIERMIAEAETERERAVSAWTRQFGAPAAPTKKAKREVADG